MLNDKYFPKDSYGSIGNFVDEEVEGFKYPHLQLRNISYSVGKGRKEEVLLDMINVEARGGELVAVLASKSKYKDRVPDHPNMLHKLQHNVSIQGSHFSQNLFKTNS